VVLVNDQECALASRYQEKRVLITDSEVMMDPSISEAMRAEDTGLVADNRDLTTHSAVEDMIHETGRTDVLSRTSYGPRVLAVFLRDIAFRLRRWRADQQTWAALRHLDDHQLKEFGIYPRPPDLTKRKFP
jgi:uncharacterized protein YjiS (DUF1127 family)